MQKDLHLGRGMVGGGVKSFFSFTLGRRVNWSAEKNMSSPKVSGTWLRAAGGSAPPPHAAFKLSLLTYSPGCVRALPKMARGMIIKNSPPWGENEPLLFYFSPRYLKPTKVTGTFIFSFFPISLTFKLCWT